MFGKLVCSLFVLCCFGSPVSASEKCGKVNQEEYSCSLCFDHGKKIKARKISLNVKGGKDCSHIARYENGEIVTQIGGLAPISGSMSLNLGGEQIVTMYNSAGQVCFTSVSKDWEFQDKIVVHHHGGFDVHTDKKKQFVVIH
jgi:hypothetical protein